MEPTASLTPPELWTKSPSLYSLVIHLGAADIKKLPATLNRAIHAQVMEWFSLADPAIAHAIHNSQMSPITLSPLLGYRRRSKPKPADDFHIRISLLDGNLLEPLLSGLAQWETQLITIANCSFVFRSVETLPGTHPQVRSADFSLLSQATVSSSDITLEFLSPTSFKQHKKDIQPFPLPELVFNSLRQRWNAFAPEHLQLPELDWHGLVSAFDLKTHALRMEGGPEIGCQGWVTYRFPDPEQAKFATTLAHFAFFAGVGRKTTMGMGQTRLLARSPLDRKPH